MSRLCPRARFSARMVYGSPVSNACPASLVASRDARSAFTLIELLVVIAVIAILAGLTLSIMGGVQNKSARSRAQAEVASISAAIDNYFLDTGRYPSMDTSGGSVGTDLSGVSDSVTTTNLYTELCGGSKVYFEPKAGMLKTNTNAPPNISFIDPWGDDYFYSTAAGAIRNVGSFDFWSGAGTRDKAADDIRN